MTELRCKCGKRLALEEPGRLSFTTETGTVEVHLGVIVWTCRTCRRRIVRNVSVDPAATLAKVDTVTV